MERNKDSEMSENEVYSITELPDNIKDVICGINISIKNKEGKKQKIASGNFLSNLIVNYDNLEQELEQLPSDFGLWSALLAEAEEQYNLKRRRVDYKRSQLFDALLGVYNKEEKKIKSSTGEGIDRLPQWQAKVMVESDEELNKAEIEAIIARKQYLKIRTVVEALKMKSEHMRSLAGFKRTEQRSQPSK